MRDSSNSVSPSGLSSLVGLVRGDRWTIVVLSVLSLAVGAMGWAIAFLVQSVLDQKSNLPWLDSLALGTALLMVMRSGVGVIRRWIQSRVVRNIQGNLGKTLLAHVLRLETRSMDSASTGDLLRRVRSLEHVRIALEDRIFGVTFDVLLVVIAAGIMAGYNLLLTFIAIMGALLPAIVVMFIRNFVQRSFESTQAEESRLTSTCLEMFDGARDLRLCRGVEWMAGRVAGDYASHLDSRRRHFLRLISIQGFTGTLSSLMSILVLAVGAHVVESAEMTTGQLMFVFTMAGMMLGPLESLAISWLALQDAIVALRQHDELLRLPSEPRIALSQQGAIVGHLHLHEVSFDYRPGRRVLSGISLEIPAGSSLAIVGESGAGKSTLLSLLAGLYPPDLGSILVDGKDLREIPPDQWRQHVGVVLQAPRLFSTTVEENIRLGCPEATSEDVRIAARLACAEEFILALPRGFGTVLLQQDGKLSAGQAQRIALARALVRKPRVLLFDEATSALDLETESAIWSALEASASPGRTMIFVTHRLASSRAADRIVVLQEGKVVEEGTFEELMRRQGPYERLWRRQFPALDGNALGHKRLEATSLPGN